MAIFAVVAEHPNFAASWSRCLLSLALTDTPAHMDGGEINRLEL